MKQLKIWLFVLVCDSHLHVRSYLEIKAISFMSTEHRFHVITTTGSYYEVPGSTLGP